MATVIFSNADITEKSGEAVDPALYAKVEEAARQLIHAATGREFTQQTLTEERVNDYNKDGILLCAHRDVQSVSAITTAFIDTTQPTQTVLDKYIDVRPWGVLLRATYGNDYYKVTYVAGESTVPQVIKDIALGLAKRIITPPDKPDGLVSMSEGGASFQFDQADWDTGRYTGNDEWDAVLNAPEYNTRRYTTQVG